MGRISCIFYSLDYDKNFDLPIYKELAFSNTIWFSQTDVLLISVTKKCTQWSLLKTWHRCKSNLTSFAIKRFIEICSWLSFLMPIWLLELLAWCSHLSFVSGFLEENRLHVYPETILVEPTFKKMRSWKLLFQIAEMSLRS